jgi:hypothetical protein
MYQDDVFHLYEQNKSLEDDLVLPIMIGEQDTKCRLGVRTYIKVGEECSVCLEPMYHKTDAFLTGCGHAFHKKCLSSVFKAKWEVKPLSTLKCPLCRCGLGCPELFVRYSYESENPLDKLENFWITKDCLNPDLCLKGNHYLGMKKSCQTCLHYRATGLT